MAGVALQDLTVRFGDFTAVDEISLSIAEGEFIVLLGPSGCGKTTTLRCIAGLEQATSGAIAFNGERVERLSPRDRKVAMVFQFVSLYPHMTVRQNIAFPLEAHGERGADVRKKVAWVAKVFALTAILDKKPRALPPGDWQKAALARAMVRRPKVLLLDEPLSAIDEQFREEMRWELKHIQKELGTTTIHVTHDQREAMSLADRVVLMRDGQLVQVGTPQSLYDDPADDFAAVFIGSPSMNLIPARVSPDGLHAGGHRLSLADHRMARIAAALEGEIRIGIRPHDVTPCGGLGEGDSEGILETEVTGSYVVGRETYFDFLLDGQPMKGVANGGAPPGGAARIRLDPERLLFFAPDGRRVRP